MWAEVLCYRGGSEGWWGGLQGAAERKEGVVEMNRAACRGAVYRSTGARAVGRRIGVPSCAGRSHIQDRLLMGPYLFDGGRTAVT